MKIDELIEKLRDSMALHGNIDVHVRDYDGNDYGSVDDITIEMGYSGQYLLIDA